MPTTSSRPPLARISVQRLFLIAALLLGLTGFAWAQKAASAPGTQAAGYALKGTNIDGSAFDLAALQGKVTMVFYWSTACDVCRSHLPELRANLAGWSKKPFALVTANMDKNFADWLAYENLAAKTQSVRPLSIWTKPQSSMHLPLTVVLDAKGRVVKRIEGRIAPEAWDAVADLLP